MLLGRVGKLYYQQAEPRGVPVFVFVAVGRSWSIKVD